MLEGYRLNLVPSSIVVGFAGKVNQLPSICQYLSEVLDNHQTLQIGQLDMTSAFYLFALPEEWRHFMALNLVHLGEHINKRPGVAFCLSCCVLTMGWSSAVAIMEEISEHLLKEQGFDTISSWFSWCCL